jgi:hypothetical protein
MDVYWKCQGGPCGHPCDLDFREHEVCEEDPYAACDHTCGCASNYRATLGLISSLLG